MCQTLCDHFLSSNSVSRNPFGTNKLRHVILASLVLIGCSVQIVRAENTEELVTEKDVKTLAQKGPQYFKALNKTSLNQSETNLIKEFMRVQVLQMSIENKREQLPDIRTKLKREIDLRAEDVPRAVMLKEITKNCELLFDHPLPVKLNAVMLITELNQDSGVLSKQIPPTPYLGMVDPLLKIINDENQHEAMKVVAVNGLQRLCRDASPKVDVRTRIAEALVNQLNLPDISEWYGMICVQTLARTEVIINTQRQPFVIQKLAEILVDNKQGWRIRADAAYALARVPYDGSTNVPLLIHEIARLSQEMSLQYNNNKAAPYWRYCYYRLYLVFKPESSRDVALLDRLGKAPVSAHRDDIQELYSTLLPVINDVMEYLPSQDVTDTHLESLKQWIDGHVPDKATVSVDPSLKLKPLRTANAAP